MSGREDTIRRTLQAIDLAIQGTGVYAGASALLPPEQRMTPDQQQQLAAATAELYEARAWWQQQLHAGQLK